MKITVEAPYWNAFHGVIFKACLLLMKFTHDFQKTVLLQWLNMTIFKIPQSLEFSFRKKYYAL